MTVEADRARLVPLFDAALADHVRGWLRSGWAPALVDACVYALSTGGKRVRPMLASMGAEAVGGSFHDAASWAVAVELIHTYSLVHDDLPCMDDDDFRRGQPTVHRKFGEALAILAGDAMLTDAFGAAVACGAAPLAARLVALLSFAAGGAGMVGGQVDDVAESPLASPEALERLHRRKTGALIRAAVVGGAMCGGGSDSQLDALAAFGESLGLLFQITDDLLDAAQDGAAGNRSYLGHFEPAEVVERRDRALSDALTALAPLGASAASLRTFAAAIASRET